MIQNSSADKKLIVCMVLLGVVYGWIALLSHRNIDIGSFMVLVSVAFVIVSWTWLSNNKQTPNFLAILWGGALLFRLIGIFSQPIYEDDYYRYLWDGYQMATTFNPYALPPEAFFNSSQGLFETVLDNINNPNLKTLYGPVCQWIFALSYWIAPAEVWPLQLIFSLFDLAIIALLLQLTSARNVLLYAWSPLVIKEISMTAHTEVIALFFLLASIILITKRQSLVIGTISLAFAIASKLFAVIAIPFLLFFYPKQLFKTLGVLSITLVICYAPLLYSTNTFGNDSGLVAMGKYWLFNAPLYFSALFFNINFNLSKLIIIGIGLIAYGVYWLKWLKTKEAIRWEWIFAGMLLMLPALNAWYGLWLLVFVAIRPSVWGWVSCHALLLSYATAQQLANYGDESLYSIPTWVLSIEFGLMILAVAISIYYYRIHSKIKTTPIST